MIEIYFLIKVGSIIGAIPTITLVVFTALLGAMLLRFQGWTTLQRARLAMVQGKIPALEMLEGVLLVVAGVFLLIPGFITDIVGFLLLVPPLRQALVGWFLSKSDGRGPPPPGGAASRPNEPFTIEGEYRRDDD